MVIVETLSAELDLWEEPYAALDTQGTHSDTGDTGVLYGLEH